MKLLEMMQNRRSVRTYTGEPISEEQLTAILQAGLLSASGKAIYPWELITVQNKETLKQMSECRGASSKMLAGAEAAGGKPLCLRPGPAAADWHHHGHQSEVFHQRIQGSGEPCPQYGQSGGSGGRRGLCLQLLGHVPYVRPAGDGGPPGS